MVKKVSLLALKQQISRLTQRDRRELSVYLLRLKHATPAWKRATAKKIREMKAGKFTTIGELEARLARR